MGGFAGIWQWVIVLVIVLILFGGRGKIARVMGDVGKGIRSFKSGIGSENREDEDKEDNGGNNGTAAISGSSTRNAETPAAGAETREKTTAGN